MENNISVAEAKAAFSECISKVEAGFPVVITRHGKPVAALVPPNDLEHLERLRKAGPEKGLARIAGGWEEPRNSLGYWMDLLGHLYPLGLSLTRSNKHPPE